MNIYGAPVAGEFSISRSDRFTPREGPPYTLDTRLTEPPSLSRRYEGMEIKDLRT
jgi:hypothetical protein